MDTLICHFAPKCLHFCSIYEQFPVQAPFPKKQCLHLSQSQTFSSVNDVKCLYVTTRDRYADFGDVSRRRNRREALWSLYSFAQRCCTQGLVYRTGPALFPAAAGEQWGKKHSHTELSLNTGHSLNDSLGRNYHQNAEISNLTLTELAPLLTHQRRTKLTVLNSPGYPFLHHLTILEGFFTNPFLGSSLSEGKSHIVMISLCTSEVFFLLSLILGLTCDITYQRHKKRESI